MIRRRSLAPSLLILLLAGPFACGRDATAPARTMRETAAPLADHRGHQPNGGQAAYVRCETHPAYTGSADIGPRGGRVTAGNVTLYVPPGALSRTVHITATVPAGDAAYVEFEPSGLRFRRPAGLLFHAEGCNVPPDPDVLYVSDDGHVLERIDARYIAYLQLVAAPIEHFSGYVLAW